jgi:hypothetical protein
MGIADGITVVDLGSGTGTVRFSLHAGRKVVIATSREHRAKIGTSMK